MRVFCLFVLSFGVLAPGALAGFAVCNADWEWASNSKQQNPCETAGALDAACWGFSEVDYIPLPPGVGYLIPQPNSTMLDCDCNTVMFSLIMGCYACQNRSTQSWSYWKQYCKQVYISDYPQKIPPSTAIPNWAYVNYALGDMFNPTDAKSAGRQPERVASGPSTILPSSTAAGGSQQSNQSKTMGTPTGSISTSPSGTATGSNQQKPSKVAAIVGGVIGGLGFLLIVGAVLYLLRIRKARRKEVDKDHPDYPGGAFMSEYDKQSPPLRLYVSSSFIIQRVFRPTLIEPD
ncbi:hypothetical protein BDM02DRAFT_3169605 [Thelephora ganbajun]|uniref:Uncharacterized protein n=1 Tax=Thelephora ganbajun TaxID=370292 RepID=A0ACB6ZDU8_THEGA|nr:hypothetical protein BDM02DRAFT_3169605 [Thelephora ganbajun]